MKSEVVQSEMQTFSMWGALRFSPLDNIQLAFTGGGEGRVPGSDLHSSGAIQGPSEY